VVKKQHTQLKGIIITQQKHAQDDEKDLSVCVCEHTLDISVLSKEGAATLRPRVKSFCDGLCMFVHLANKHK